MALIILGHPNIEQSVANKTIIENVQTNMPDIEIRNIHQLYPDYQINVQEEQAALLRHNLIVLQYPMYWFNMPAILKIWFDEVLTYQFAYGSNGDKLKNKKLLPSLTIGANQEVYQQDGHNLIDDFLQPVKISTIYTQMQYLSPIFIYGVSPVIESSHDKIKALALKQSQRLQEIIKQHS